MPALQATETQRKVGNSTSPIHTVPAEILATIFIFCLPPHEAPFVSPLTEDPTYQAIVLRMPLVIGSICRQWRSIAFSMGELWSFCVLDFVWPELNASWLRRAGDRTLHLYGIAERHSLRQRDDIDVTKFLQSISPFLPQCHSLLIPTEIFGASQYWLSEPDAEEYITDVSKLRVLCTCPYPVQSPPNKESVWLPPWIRVLLQKSVNITTLRLWEHVNHSNDELHGDAPISHLVNLTDLHLTDVLTISDLYCILRDSPRLESVNFTVSPSTPRVFMLFSPNVTHYHITRLELTLHPDNLGEVVIFLESVTLPALQSLILHSELTPWICLQMIDTFRRSRCSLKELKLWCYQDTLPLLINLLRHDSVRYSLESFTFSFQAITNEFIDFLTVDAKTGITSLPRLRRLSLSEIAPKLLLKGKIPEMVLSRSHLIRDGDTNLAARVAKLEFFEYTVPETLVGLSWDRSHYMGDVQRIKNTLVEQESCPVLSFTEVE